MHILEGLHALLFEGDDYIGEPVNLAARLCSIASGQNSQDKCETNQLRNG